MADKITPVVAQLFLCMGYDVNMVKPIWTITEAAQNGESFSGSVLRVVLRDDPDASDPAVQSPHILCFIVKLPPANAAARDSHFSSAHAFRREKFFFERLIPAFQAFQIERRTAAIATHGAAFDLFASVPSCLYASDAERAEYVILGDLCKDGYATAERTQPLAEARVRLVLRRLAHFHAISFAFKAQQPHAFERELLVRGEPQLREIMFARPVRADLVACMTPNVQLVLDALAADADRSDRQPLAERLSRFRSDEYVEAMARCCETAQRSKRGAAEAVVLHDDCWISNLMFHESGEEMVFVDWQGARYGSVALDLAHFLFCCTDAATRAGMDELLRLYHGALMQRIGELGSDGERLMPFARLQANMLECGVFGVGMAIMTLHATTCPSAEMVNVAKCMESGMDVQAINRHMAKNPAYQRRIVDVCRDAVRLGYL